jgi:hypothetical protein
LGDGSVARFQMKVGPHRAEKIRHLGALCPVARPGKVASAGHVAVNRFGK